MAINDTNNTVHLAQDILQNANGSSIHNTSLGNVPTPKLIVNTWREDGTLLYPFLSPTTGVSTLPNPNTFVQGANEINLGGSYIISSNFTGEYQMSIDGANCGYYMAVGFHIDNWAFGNAGAMYAPINGVKGWSCLSSEKHCSISLTNSITDITAAPGTEYAYPKLYFSIDEWDPVANEWDHAKAVLQIMERNSCMSYWSDGRLVMDSTNGYVAKTAVSEDFTNNGLNPIFHSITPNAPQYHSPTFSAGAHPHAPAYLNSAGDPNMTGVVLIPYADDTTAPDIGGVPRKFRFNTIYIKKRYLEHSSVRTVINANPNDYPSIIGGGNYYDIADIQRLLKATSDANPSDQIAQAYQARFEVEQSGNAQPPLSTLCDDPDGSNGGEPTGGDYHGCTDSSADNYDSGATADDCSCDYCTMSPSVSMHSMMIELLQVQGDPCSPTLGFSNISQAIPVIQDPMVQHIVGSVPGVNDGASDYVQFATQGATSYCDGTVQANNYLSVKKLQNGTSTFIAPASTVTTVSVPLNNVTCQALWDLEPGTVYTVLYHSVYDVTACSGCDLGDPELLPDDQRYQTCAYQYMFTTPECPDEEEPDNNTYYVCMCEDCDQHFTVTGVDCNGNDITQLLADHGADWENFVDYETSRAVIECGCEDIVDTQDCGLTGFTWATIAEAPSSGGDPGLIDIEITYDFQGHATYQDFIAANGFLAIELTSGSNNITHSGVLFVTPGGGPTLGFMQGTGEPLMVFDDPNNNHVQDINGSWKTIINKAPCGSIGLKVYTVTPGQGAYDFVQVCEAGDVLTVECPDETPQCPEPSGNFYAEPEDETCIGYNDGSVFIGSSGYGAVGPFDYTMYLGSDTSGQFIASETDADNFIVDNLAVGDYYVAVTDSNDCEHYVTFTINSTTPIIFSVLTTEVSTNGGSDGTATVNNVTGGAGNYIIDWTDSDGNVVNNLALPAGTYNVTITDANGCSVTSTATIVEPDCVITIQGSTANPTISTASDGSISLSISGGMAPYDISWIGPNDFESSKATITDLAQGTYYVMVCSYRQSPTEEPCCGFATFTLLSGDCLTEEQEALILDKVNEILNACDCILPPVQNTDLPGSGVANSGSPTNNNYTNSGR
jgi:hypothetical protein